MRNRDVASRRTGSWLAAEAQGVAAFRSLIPGRLEAKNVESVEKAEFHPVVLQRPSHPSSETVYSVGVIVSVLRGDRPCCLQVTHPLSCQRSGVHTVESMRRSSHEQVQGVVRRRLDWSVTRALQ